MRVLELHAPVQVVQRSKGRSATAAAAYRSATRIECERTGMVHDYTRKGGVEDTAILLPDEAPDWAHDRAALWNAAEAREKHPRAQTAREVQVAFPAEFSPEHRRQAGLQLGSWLVSRYGTAVDLAWHQPSPKGDQRNHHLHALFTTRRFENGEWSKNKDRSLDDLKKGPDEVIAMRGAFAGILNDIAVRENLGVYVEHLSFEARGLDREATQHMGPNASEMERRGEPTAIGDHNRAVEVRNEAREQLYQDRNATKKDLGGEKRDQGAEDLSPAPITEFHPAAWVPLYVDTTKRRRALLQEQDKRYGAQERELRQSMAGLQASIDHRNSFVRFWRRVTGRTRQEKAELQRLTASYDRIQEEKRVAQVQFERDRQARIEAMKAEYRNRERDRGQYPAQLEMKVVVELSSTQGKVADDLVKSGGSGTVSGKEKRAAFMQRQEPTLSQTKIDPQQETSSRRVDGQQSDAEQDRDDGPEQEWG